MTPNTAGQDEPHLAKNPSIEPLESLGYSHVPPQDHERDPAHLKEMTWPVGRWRSFSEGHDHALLDLEELFTVLVVVRSVGYVNDRLPHGPLDEPAQSPTTVLYEIVERVLSQQIRCESVAGQQHVHLAVV